MRIVLPAIKVPGSACLHSPTPRITSASTSVSCLHRFWGLISCPNDCKARVFLIGPSLHHSSTSFWLRSWAFSLWFLICRTGGAHNLLHKSALRNSWYSEHTVGKCYLWPYGEFHREISFSGCKSCFLKSDLLLPFGTQICIYINVSFLPGLQISINLGVCL